MACIPFSGSGVVGHICCADHFVSLEAFGAKVWCEFHHYLGPTFYRSKNAIKVIETPSRKTWMAFSAWHASTFKPTNAEVEDEEAELVSLRKDAKRYRALRDNGYLDRLIGELHPCDESRRIELTDAQVDSFTELHAPKTVTQRP